ncbi:MAG: hypothetical protein O7F71_02215 [Gammaproteobacteria bacterium]|nr:hypothetical protein [Gammaproteobacteria bacterium]
MADLIKFLGGMFALLAMKFGDVGWYLLKAAVLVAIVIGAGSEVIDLAPAEWPPFELSLGVLGEYINLAFLTASNGWRSISLALLFYAVWVLMLPSVMKIESHTYQTKVAVVAIANYLEIQVETDLTKSISKEGWIRSFLNQAKWQPLLWLLSGQQVDDSLSARPVRGGSAVSLLEDLKHEVDGASERTEASISGHVEWQMEQLAAQIERILESKLN